MLLVTCRYADLSSHFTAPTDHDDVSLVSGATTVEFLNFEFDAFITLPSELVLTGRKSTMADGGRWSYMVESVTNDDSTAGATAFGVGDGVRKLSESVSIAAVDFVQPFSYSSSTWVHG